ncbi:hypothetical protein N2152v2_011124 [Parachlorella kessleri]
MPAAMSTHKSFENVCEPKHPLWLQQTTTGFHKSELQRDRLHYQPTLPKVLRGHLVVAEGEERRCENEDEHDRICSHFPRLAFRPMHLVHLVPSADPFPGSDQPLRVGVTLSGGQAAGGHNVIVGIFDSLQRWRPGSKLFGFLQGYKGVLANQHKELTQDIIDGYRNQGGFNMIGSGRDKIETKEELAAAEETCRALQLDGLVCIGEGDPNTNTAELAEYFLQRGVGTRVIGVPKTIDGDLRNRDVPISFGFDTACKVYSELIGNVMLDAKSAAKYFHFIRLMGRSASHITLECALQTHPQMALVAEEVAANKLNLHDLAVQVGAVAQVADMVQLRVEAGKNYGVILIPEGLIMEVQDVRSLISEINGVLAGGVSHLFSPCHPHHPAASPSAEINGVLAEINGVLAGGVSHEDHEAVERALSPSARDLFSSMPLSFKYELLLERDPHGNVQVARISTEKLLIRLVEHELEKRREAGLFSGKFNALSHYFGYEGRSSLPTNFDATYAYVLGLTASMLVGADQTGLMATISNLSAPAEEWGCGGTPLVSMMTLKRKAGGRVKPEIVTSRVEMDGPMMRTFRSLRGRWMLQDCYRCPGPIQFQESASADLDNMTLAVELNGGDPICLVD